MYKRVFVLMAALLAAACAQAPSVPVATETTIQNIDLPVTRIVEGDAPRWVETQTGGVEIGAWLPPGWQVDTTGGLTMVEHMSSLRAGELSNGITFRVFVPDVDSLIGDDTTHSNLAHAVLEQVTRMSDLTQGALVSDPVAFEVNAHQAAYYLFTSPEDVHGLVLALAVNEEHKIVVVNITAPPRETTRLHSVLPLLLSDLRINRQRLTADLLEALPDRLEFPADTATN